MRHARPARSQERRHRRNRRLAGRGIIQTALVFAEFARLFGAVLVAFAGMILVKSGRRPVLPWLARALAAAALFAAALWIVYLAVPNPADPGVPTYTIVGSAVLIAALAAEEFVGADIRRLLRI